MKGRRYRRPSPCSCVQPPERAGGRNAADLLDVREWFDGLIIHQARVLQLSRLVSLVALHCVLRGNARRLN
ncbi:hypothetical protein JG687_00014082 [Phytophthora cactorum]|uniref:Uncharacterized protein n=1 Tax=Phytophthora cactorum TaxID=29920 RepID=A0A8T1TZL8_9STRA|nr:hypothetical protein GQ600_18577 [Phytophthora cactorum]KAG6950704.1 hypothetical protein JG687_00014082 [Phytophthora cactorum]